MNKFIDVPFNFDDSFIYAIENIRFKKYYVNSFYFNPFGEDYQENELTYSSTTPLDREDYERWFKDYFTPNLDLNLFKLQLLLENENTIMTEQQLEYYINLGFSQFSCSSMEQAEIIKNVYPEAEIIGSMFMDINKEKLEDQNLNYKDYFSKFVLPLNYNRRIKGIDKLPKDYEYIIVPNANAFLQIDSNTDVRENLLSTEDVPRISDPRKFKNLSKIRPVDLKFFYNKNVSSFRLWNPNWPTAIILQDLLVYSYPYENYVNLNYNENLYNFLNNKEGIV